MRKRLGFAAVMALLVLLLAPVPAVARPDQRAPVTVPALTRWTPESGAYAFRPGARLVADGPAARRVADTLAGDLRAAGHGTVPVVRGGARTGDIVVDIRSSRTSLGAEGYELHAGSRLSITGATETGAFHGTRTLLQLLAQDDRIPAGRTVDVPRYKERGCLLYTSDAADE